MTLYEIVRDLLTSCGPWAFSTLVRQVKAQTGYQKGLDYEYHVEKHARNIESMQTDIQEPMVIWDE